MSNLKLVAENPVWIKDVYRRDGLRIERALGQWVVVPKDGHGVMTSRCPCCNSFLTTVEAARRTADTMYPLGVDDGADVR